MSNIKKYNRKRLLTAFAIVCFCLTVLCFRCGWWQIVRAEFLTDKAAQQQTRDSVVEAKRGTIYDCNGIELAVTGSAYSVWARPAELRQKDKDDKKNDLTAEVIDGLADNIKSMSRKEIRKAVKAKQSLIKVAKGLDKKTADKIRELGLPGIEISEDTKRYYPMGAFASHLLGSVSDDNTGLSGLEAYYNSSLTGVSGRWIENTDVNGKQLSYGKQEYYEPKDGNDLVLTLDSNIQNWVENAIQSCYKKTKAQRVMAMIMDPETGDILSMAVYPEYDSNNPRDAMNETDQAALDNMSDKQKVKYWNKMWRNPLIQDTYEPGSTFKLFTTSMALEEGLTTPSEHFVDNGSYDVSGTTLKCWNYQNPHGNQSLKVALGNSCNPVFIQLGLRIGMDRYYEYLESFGFEETTGVDYPSEAGAILQNQETAGPVDLATMSYGQGIAVTPIQLLTAVCAIGNGGNMLKPHLVKKKVDASGNTTYEAKPEIVRQILSKKTSKQVCKMMEYVVEDGGVQAAYIDGYRVGGKTGTANKPKKGGYSENTYSSFVGMAPMDDPKVAILVIVDSPKGVKYGSATAAPCAQKILKKVLPYLHVEKQESKTKDENLVKVPDVTGLSYQKAVDKLEKKGFVCKVKSGKKSSRKFKVVNQYPKADTKKEKGATVYIYGE